MTNYQDSVCTFSPGSKLIHYKFACSQGAGWWFSILNWPLYLKGWHQFVTDHTQSDRDFIIGFNTRLIGLPFSTLKINLNCSWYLTHSQQSLGQLCLNRVIPTCAAGCLVKEDWCRSVKTQTLEGIFIIHWPGYIISYLFWD